MKKVFFLLLAFVVALIHSANVVYETYNLSPNQIQIYEHFGARISIDGSTVLISSEFGDVNGRNGKKLFL